MGSSFRLGGATSTGSADVTVSFDRRKWVFSGRRVGGLVLLCSLHHMQLSPSAVEDEGEEAAEAPTGHRDRSAVVAADGDESLPAERGDVDAEEWMH